MTASAGIGADDVRTRDRVVAFGRAVTVLRLRSGLTQQQLAEKAGCDRQSVNRVENATYSPSLPRIFRLADALGVPAADLFAPARWVDDTDPSWSIASGGTCSTHGCVGAAVAGYEKAGRVTQVCAGHLARYGRRRLPDGRLQVAAVGGVR